MLSKIISEENVKEAYSLIKHAENVVIVSHMGPDGDAVGSSLGKRKAQLPASRPGPKRNREQTKFLINILPAK